MFPLQGAWIQSLFWELSSLMPHSTAEKIKGIDLFNLRVSNMPQFFFFLINIFRLKNIPFILTVLSLCC